MYLVSNSYTLKWEFVKYPCYKVTACKRIINVKSNRIIKRCVNGGSVGYWIKGDWVNEKNVNKKVRVIQNQTTPF